MIDIDYGISEVETYDDSSTIVPVTLAGLTNDNISEYTITMDIFNEITECIVIADIPVTNVNNTLSSELISKLPSICIVRYKIKNNNTNEVKIDKTRVRIKHGI